jgi:flagellar biosynthesis protein FliR
METFLDIVRIGMEVFGVEGNATAFASFLMLVFARFGAFVLTAPFLGGEGVPKKAKIAIASAFVVLTFPALWSGAISAEKSSALTLLGFFALAVKEVGVGFTLGYVSSIVFYGVFSAGRLIDHQRGLTLGELYVPVDRYEYSQFGSFQFLLAIVVFFTVGAHRFFLSALVRSFEIVPLYNLPAFEPGLSKTAGYVVLMSAGVFNIAVQLAIPFIIVLLFAEFLYGVLNRVAPQIDTFFLGMPVKLVTAVLVLAVGLRFVTMRMVDYFDEYYKGFELFLEQVGKTI